MIPDWRVKIGQLTIYSTERFYEGTVRHFHYIRGRKQLWYHYIYHFNVMKSTEWGFRGGWQMKVLGFILTWWSKQEDWVDPRPTQWDRLLD